MTPILVTDLMAGVRVFAAEDVRPIEVDRILAVVDGQLITRSKLELYRAWLVLTLGGGLDWPQWVPDAGRLSDAEMLELLITDEVLFSQSTTSEALRVREKILQERMARFKSLFEKEADEAQFLARFELTSEGLREFLTRRQRVAGYVDFMMRSERPGTDEIRAFYDANRTDLGTLSLASTRSAIEARIYERRSGTNFRARVLELQRRAQIVRSPGSRSP